MFAAWWSESSRVAAWRLGPSGLSAPKTAAASLFHIRFNRPSSLFARCWLLVEGETETWVINELARQCGHHFDAEGIKVIEFAQSRQSHWLNLPGEWGLNGMYWSMAMKQKMSATIQPVE